MRAISTKLRFLKRRIKQRAWNDGYTDGHSDGYHDGHKDGTNDLPYDEYISEPTSIVRCKNHPECKNCEWSIISRTAAANLAIANGWECRSDGMICFECIAKEEANNE